MKTIIYSILIILLSNFAAFADSTQIDSLLSEVKNKKLSAEKTISIYKEIGAYYYNNNMMDSSILYYNLSKELAIKNADRYNEVFALIEIGVCYDVAGKYKEAGNYQFNALNKAEEYKIKNLETKALINLGILNFNLRKGNIALEYYQKAINIATEENDSMSLIRTYNNIGNTYMTIFKDLNKAEPYFTKTVSLGRKIGYKSAVKVGLNNLTEIYSNTNRYAKALEVSKQVLSMDPKCPYALYNLGSIYYLQKNNAPAIEYMLKALKYADFEIELKQVILNDISSIYEQTGDYKNALHYHITGTALTDSIHNLQSEKHIAELETKYATEKRKKEISILTAQKKQKTIQIYALCILLLIGGFIAVIIYRNIMNRRIITEQTIALKEQKIQQLEKDRQIIASHAVIEGEERERGRLARDLHDGLGGLLSGVKLKLTSLRGNYIIENKTIDQFDHILNLIDTSIKELRTISHNMMPIALLKFGLKDALNDFIAQINKSNTIEISFQFYGMEKRITSTLEITIYRIAMELMNNVLKHAEASQIIVLLIQEENRVYLTVQDNGKGFNYDQVDSLKSSGLQNIRKRIESFGGRLDISSAPNKGTEIGVEFKNPFEIV